jgi:protein-tyrosine phosphatase
MQQPIKHCYWVVVEKLLAGEYPRTSDEESSKKKLQHLLDSGIRVFIDLTEKNEGLLPYSPLLVGAVHKRFPIRDVSVPQKFELTTKILDTIDHHLERGQPVYVHCWGGVGRTGVIIGCWLARHGLGGKAALECLRELWQQCPKSHHRNSPETIQQVRYICDWEAGR